ncbi:hypothetical protein B1748_33760 [Paenibacillus sp. MY03]|jgi:hypothetical protein|uniref:hypothetical protein n=1 Tax=Paenibacillus sp. MY03 TaxID=302980 RepID=UPI000B3CF07C|nr:hypothetical protein [Paenibacillus sp. MY03]OUS68458.1 hypothetical protein B1748_33760 [Paenibacillus sp. MY03]
MKNVKTALFLLATQFLYVFGTIFWAIFVLMTLLMMDQADDINTVQMLSMIMMYLFPAASIGAPIASWIFYHKRQFAKAAWIGAIPLLWVFPFFGFFE